MFKRTINYIELILVNLIAILFVIDSISIKGLDNAPIVINGIMIIYILIHLIRKKEIYFLQNKLDVLVLLFIASTAIPLISNTYISLYTTVTTILEYITLLWCYILVKQICQKKDNQIELLQTSLIIISIILVLLGIENITANKIFGILGIHNIKNGEGRLVSLIGNPNALSAILAFSFFLSIHKAIYTVNNRKKVMYSTINIVLMIGIFLTYSKAMFLIFPLMLIIYMFCVKNKEKNIYIIQNTIVSSVIAVFYAIAVQHYMIEPNNLAIFIFSFFLLISSILFNVLNIKLTKYLIKINIKLISSIVILFIILASFYIISELTQSKDWIVFNENSSSEYNAKKISNIEPNTNYKLIFTMNCRIDLENEEEKLEAFQINMIQRDEKNKEISSQEETFGEFNGTKVIELETTEYTKELKIEFKCKYKNAQKQWIISNLQLDDKNVILEYKHLPTKLVEKIKDINLQYKTAKERIVFIKDGLKLISQNFLTGIGGGGWQYKYHEVQEYEYTSNDPHSYVVQVWLEFGIIGIISLVGIVIEIVIHKENKNLGIKFAILTILAHSIIDLDMYYIYIKLLLFLGVAILSSRNKTINHESKITYLVNSILLIIAVSIIIVLLNPKIYQKYIEIDEISKSQIGMYVNSEEYMESNYKKAKAYEKMIQYERDNSRVNKYEVKKMEAYVLSKTEELEDIVEQYYEKMIIYKNKAKYQEDKIVEKSCSINQCIHYLETLKDPCLDEWIAKLAKINIDEFEETKKQLENVCAKNFKDIYQNEYYSILLINYENSINIYNQYY